MKQIERTELETVIYNYSPQGLTFSQAKARLKRYGENRFTREKIKGWKVFLSQFINPLSFILAFAAALSIFMGEYSDGAIILTIVILNSSLSFIQEFRSGKAVEKLSQLIERRCLAVRDNEQIPIDASQLVPGDVLLLRQGDLVPADVKIMNAYDLLVNESQLTGESTPVSKGSVMKDTKEELLYTGSVIERGSCQCVVFATGDRSHLGKISSLSKDTKKQTQYQQSLVQFSRELLRIIGAAIILMLTIKAFTIESAGEFTDVLIFAVALAMTVVPEALPMITTINLSHGALRLAKQNAVAKRLSAIEDLGRINLLCTDKTGTLTEDKLAVSGVVSNDEHLFQTLAFLSLEHYDRNPGSSINSFDCAFSRYISDTVRAESGSWKQLLSVPFDPALRRRRVIVQNQTENKTYLIVVGAPETLLSLSLKDGRSYEEELAEAGRQGMRQLAIAYKEISDVDHYEVSENERDLIFAGFAKLWDPLRSTAKSAIHQAKALGVDVKILSGDSPEVAGYIGMEVGLIRDGDKVYTGDELDDMDEFQLESVLAGCSVFARVTPEQKYNIIRHLKKDHVVGYQGDGINDAPSLKLADVSIAVHSATDVAKDSADIVLLEDDLGVIVNAVQYGRSIFVNINKYIKHAMIGNLGNFFSLIFFYLVLGADIPMLAIQLLIGNIIQDMPLMTVFSDSVDPSEIKKPQSTVQIKSIMRTSLKLGGFTAVYYLFFFLFVGTESTPLTQSTLFLFYNFTQLFIIISVRNNQHFFWQGTKPSRLLIGTITLFMAVSAALVYLPFTAGVMGFQALPPVNFAVLAAVSIAYLCLLDAVKIVLNKVSIKSRALKVSTNIH